MTDHYQELPPEITALVNKGATQGLTAAEKQTLSSYVNNARGVGNPQNLEFIRMLMAEPSIDVDQGTPASGPGNPLDALFGGGSEIPATPAGFGGFAAMAAGSVSTMLGSGASAAPGPPTSSGAPLSLTNSEPSPVNTALTFSDDYPITNANPGVSTIGGGNSDDVATNDPSGNVPPAQGSGRDRRPRADREDWKAQRDAIAGADVGTLPESSAFAGIDPGLLPGFAQNPELAAQQIARSRGGGAASASILAPQLGAAMGLDAAGVLAGDRQLGGGRGAGDRLALSEAFVNSMGPGSFVEPGGVYRRALKNAMHTPVESMFTGEGDPGDITNQIQVTNGALASSAPYMTKDASDALAAQLQNAGDEYILAVANGEIDPGAVTYPMWLKHEKKAKRWVGRGLTQEQIAAAF